MNRSRDLRCVGRTARIADYDLMDRAPMVPHAEVVTSVRDRRLHGRGIGWIDAHPVASALVRHLPLWTVDPPLAAVAKELRIAYESSAATLERTWCPASAGKSTRPGIVT
jgi:hypothetical protein